MLPCTVIGLIGEHITAAAIISMGWKITLAQQDHLDLVAWHPDENNFYRIQVKTSFCRAQSKSRNPCYHFQNGSGRFKKILDHNTKYDILAHCAANHRRCHFQASHTISKVTERYRPERFDDPTIELESWTKAVEDVKNFRKKFFRPRAKTICFLAPKGRLLLTKFSHPDLILPPIERHFLKK